jgi:hypothetical protein
VWNPKGQLDNAMGNKKKKDDKKTDNGRQNTSQTPIPMIK